MQSVQVMLAGTEFNVRIVEMTSLKLLRLRVPSKLSTFVSVWVTQSWFADELIRGEVS